MIRVSVLYPNQPGATFDMDYYLNQHIPMLRRLLGAALTDVQVDVGLGGAMPGTPAPYVTICCLSFEALDSFQRAFAPHMGTIVADVPKYTNTQPTVQISEVKL